jgi:glycosyltransferase involved in cell wall biosynthesis
MNIGWITPALPYVPSAGGFRLYGANLIRRLSKRHSVHLISFLRDSDAEHVDWIREYCASVSVMPLPRASLLSRGFNVTTAYVTGKLILGRALLAQRIAASRAAGNWDVVHVESGEMGGMVDLRLPLPKVLSLHDSQTLRCAEMLKCSQSIRDKLYFHWLLLHESRYEPLVYPHYGAVTVVAEPDVRSVRSVVPNADVRLIPYGTDTEYFHPMPVEKEPATMVFHSHLGYPPNIEAALSFANEIFPKVRQKIADAVFHLVGAKPGPKILELASRPGIKISADLPDLRSAVCSAQVYVCPIRYGTGLKSKMLEAMAMRMPIVGYPGATVGLNCTNGKHVLEAQTAEEFTCYTIELLENRERAEQLATCARRFVEENFSWEARANAYEELYQELIERQSCSPNQEVTETTINRN